MTGFYPCVGSYSFVALEKLLTKVRTGSTSRALSAF